MMVWLTVIRALLCTSLSVQAAPCSFVDIVHSWSIGFKAVAKIKMEETVDHWDVAIQFSENVIELEAWKGRVTKISSMDYNISNKCFNSNVYSCQCLEIPFLVRHQALWTGNMSVTFNGLLTQPCALDECRANGCHPLTSMEDLELNEYFLEITERYGDYTNFNNSIEKMRYIESALVNDTVDKVKPPDADYNIIFTPGSTYIETLIIELSNFFQTIRYQDKLDATHNAILKQSNNQSQCELAHGFVRASSTISKIIKPEDVGGKDMLEQLWIAVINGTSLNPAIFPTCSPNYENILWNNTMDELNKGCTNTSIGCIKGQLGGAADGLLLIGRQLNNCPTLCNHCLIPASKREGKKCFSGSGKVETTTGLKNISELVLGDYVRTSSDNVNTHFTEFIGWLLREQSSSVEMLEIFTSRRSSSLTLTANHIVFTSNSTKYADELLPGDSLVYWNGSQIVDEIVTEIRRTAETGSWSPLTRDGTLFVDGYLASCYASFQHELSDLAMTPVKAMSTILLDDEESQHKDGVRSVVKMMKKFGGWIGARERNLESDECPSTPLREIPQLACFIDKSEF